MQLCENWIYLPLKEKDRNVAIEITQKKFVDFSSNEFSKRIAFFGSMDRTHLNSWKAPSCGLLSKQIQGNRKKLVSVLL